MQWATLATSLTGITISAALLTILAIICWWLIRIRQKRYWLPILRVIDLEHSRLPKIQLRRPEWIPFLCFVGSALALLFFSLEPTQHMGPKRAQTKLKNHIFVDMSPSVSALQPKQELTNKVIDVWNDLSDSHLTLSTSYSNEIHQFTNQNDLENFLLQKSYHSEGLNIGSAMQVQLEKIGDIDRLVVLSDRDLFSWSDFNWRFLLDDMEVLLVDVSQSNLDDMNLFINRADYLSAPNALSMDWDVEIEARGKHADFKGVLTASFMDRELVAIPWQLQSQEQKIVVRASWPKMAIASDSSQDHHLVWQLREVDDAIAIDNQFRTFAEGVGQNILIVANPGGERILEDPAHQLTIAMETLNFTPRRIEWLTDIERYRRNFKLWVVLLEESSEVDRFCPRTFALERIQNTIEKSRSQPMPRIWLAPAHTTKGYRNICWCYHRLMVASSLASTMPQFCRNIYTPGEFHTAMRSLGASQVGGALGREEEAFAWVGSDDATGLEVVAFSMALRPSRATALSHARLPILLRDVLLWQGFLDKANISVQRSHSWPRVADITDLWSHAGSDRLSLGFQDKRSNVPVGESYLSQMNLRDMPPTWQPGRSLANAANLPLEDDQKNPLPWILLCAWTAILLALLEGFWLIHQRYRSLILSLFILIVGLFAHSRSTEARVHIGLVGEVGYLNQASSFDHLGKDVSHRTSLDVASKPIAYNAAQGKALLQPWLWVSANSLAREDKQISFELSHWIKRGGLLIIEHAQDLPTLEVFTKNVFVSQSEPGRWSPIPPDHEIMRSFYLLDSLPTCAGKVWNGFMFDGRIAIIAIPYSLLSTLADQSTGQKCLSSIDRERMVRIFINVLMVALATDYKKDQIHMREILKRLR